MPDQPENQAELVEAHEAALVPGERLSEVLGEPELRSARTADEISARYDRGEVRIVTEQARYPLASIPSMLASGDYKLDPDYQRRHRWSAQQKSRLIESFVMNVPVPPIFLYEWDYNKFEVMDGLQRMSALREFYSDQFELTGLEYWTELDGFRYSTLPSRIRDGVNRRYLSSIVLLRETTHGDEDPEKLKRFVFGRINTGGVHLSAQELRNALYDGPMNQLCKELAKAHPLRRLWHIPIDIDSGDPFDPDSDDYYDDPPVPPKVWSEMTDVEFVLRFFANRQRMISYRDNIRDFLDEYLKAANRFEPGVLKALADVFLGTIGLAEDLFGEFAFHTIRSGRVRNVPSVSVFDALMNVLSRMLPHREELIASKDAIRDGLVDFYDSNATTFNLRGQTRTDLMKRELEFERFLRSYIA